jgi:DNA repair ATPase RecN
MENENYIFRKRQLQTKFNATIKEIDNENIKNERKEIEIVEKYKYFIDIICEIMFSSNNILKDYYDSDNLQKIKNSDKIRKAMKNYINKIGFDEVKSLINKLDKFDNEIENILEIEIEENLNNFINDYKIFKKANALKRIDEIKEKFENSLNGMNFDIIEFEKKLNEKVDEFQFEENEINEIKIKVEKMMIDKFKELINNY